MGDGLIHVRKCPLAHSDQAKPPPFAWTTTTRVSDKTIRPYICCRSTSEAEIYQTFAQPVVFTSKIDWHMRLRAEPSGTPHHFCRDGQGAHLHLLNVSQDIRVEATKLLYSTNMWDFDCPLTLRLWIDTIPRDMIPRVRHLRLQMSMGSPKSYHHCSRLPSEWKEALGHVIPGQFPDLRSLSLVFSLEGNIVCWRKSQATTFNEIFRPLRSLSQLRNVYVIFDTDVCPRQCLQFLHDDEVHRQGMYRTFWWRKEVGRAWAEEIRAVILDDEDLPGQECLDTEILAH